MEAEQTSFATNESRSEGAGQVGDICMSIKTFNRQMENDRATSQGRARANRFYLRVTPEQELLLRHAASPNC